MYVLPPAPSEGGGESTQVWGEESFCHPELVSGTKIFLYLSMLRYLSAARTAKS